MLDINLIRNNPELVKKGIAAKNFNPNSVDEFLVLDKEWRKLRTDIDNLKAEQKKLSGERKTEEAKENKEKIRAAEGKLSEVEKRREEILASLPNLPFDDVPRGRDAADNVVLKEVGAKPKFDFKPKDYLTLAEKLGIIDVKRAAAVSGSRFGYLFKGAALLEFALINFAFEKLVKKGFIPVIPPVMIRPEVFKGMGRLGPGQEEERYYLPKDDLYLIGSAEHTIGPIHMDEVLDEKALPIRYVGFSPCFRREAGSYGKDTKGILRVHQFDKVEMFSFTNPSDSEKEHKLLLSIQEGLMKELKLPYRVVELCTADMGWTDARQYDIETWLPGQDEYRETHSASNTTDFQARGVNVKYKSKTGTNFVHMLNATAVAIGRMIIAILENYQTKEGTIKVPDLLTKYTGFKEIRAQASQV